MKGWIPVLIAVLIAALAGCELRDAGPAPPKAATTAREDVPLFEGLGPHHRAVTTRSPEAQRYFDQGLAFLYGFNQDEAIRAFAKAAELDPSCAMAEWGVAYAYGPHINNPAVPGPHAKAAWEALQKARERSAGGTPVERALIEALAARYAWPPPGDRAPLDAAYAEAMTRLAAAYPDDSDVGALSAEALMDVHPWDLWDHDGTPRPWTGGIVSRLEAVLAKDPRHPLALHLYIHAVEASPEPHKGDAAADALRNLTPALGHLVHMPSHIYVRTGQWAEAIEANARAIQADRAYRRRVPRQDFYRLYMAHNYHMLTFAAMMIGRSSLALSTIREMVAEMPSGWLKENAAWADGWIAMPLEVLMRFGRWEEILSEPEPPGYLPLSRALRHYARGVAYAALGKVSEARSEQSEFARARERVDKDAFFGNNSAADILGVAEALLDGEILYRAGEEDRGFLRLREAVKLEDALRYDEPPGWIQPVRHALGAALLQSGRYAEAEKVFRTDLARLPGNGWSLFGMGRALRMQGKNDEAVSYESRFAEAWKDADVKITSPCFCQKGV